jgi:hypothetical protein
VVPRSSSAGYLDSGRYHRRDCYQEGKRVFWDVHHPAQAVVLSLADETYDELIIEVENPTEFVLNLRRIAGR